MNELAYIFERLELSQYLENFIEEGFDTWDTVLYITESDLYVPIRIPVR
jgi:SAM domain (Sterile alpha motif)